MTSLHSGILAILNLCREHGLLVEESDLRLILAGASGRVVMRVLQQGVPCGLIAVYWTPDRADNQSYLPALQGLRQSGVPVPQLLRSRSLEQGCGVCLVEDLGSADLLSLKGQAWGTLRPAYVSALHAVHALHSLQPDWPLQPAFDAAMYRWEQEYFAEHFLGTHLGAAPDSFLNLPVRYQLADALAALPRVPVHRDFQSQNIMLRQGVAYLIDFQGMRMGRAEYDVASLVCDPYMQLTWSQAQELVAEYAALADSSTFDISVFYACALQRLMQALGAFANIGYNFKKEWYLNMIPNGRAALRMVAGATPEDSMAYPLAQWLLNHV